MHRFDMTDTIDIHVHTGPDLFPRLGDDLLVAKDCAAGGMAGMAVKCHFQGTEVRAALVNQMVPAFTMYGGITLNYGVGGINPIAVESSLRVGGSVVWGPSAHSRHHAEVTGTLGGWGSKAMSLTTPSDAAGVTVVDEDGALTSDTHEVLRLVKDRDALFATSHLSAQEALAVVDEAQRLGVRILVNHVLYIPKADRAFISEVVSRGAMVEMCSVLVGGFWNKVSMADVLDVIQQVGYESVVLSSDAGGINTALPRESLRVFANQLVYHDVPEAHVRHMMTESPRRLLGVG